MRILHITPGTARTPVIAALQFLPHTIHYAHLDHSSLLAAPPCDVALLDATRTLAPAPAMHERLAAVGIEAPLVVVLSEGGLAAASPDWNVADVILPNAGPAEVDARLRLARIPAPVEEAPSVTVSGPLTIDEDGFTATVHGRPLDLTYKEFELLRHLATHPGRAFTRAQLLHDVWGYDYYGGTRTVDVHIRRLRAKLGAELESAIHTVRNVGYRFSPQNTQGDR